MANIPRIPACIALVRVLREAEYMCVYIYIHKTEAETRERQVYYQELAHTITEAEQSPGLRLGSWGPRRALGVGSSLSPSLKAEGAGGRVNVPVLHLFILPMPPKDGGRPTHGGEGDLLSSVYQFRCRSHPETPPRTPQGTIGPSVSAPYGPVKLTCKINHHRDVVERTQSRGWVLGLLCHVGQVSFCSRGSQFPHLCDGDHS